MKVIKFNIIVLIIFLLGIVTCYASIDENDWTSSFVKGFEETGADFKYYNINVSCSVSGKNSEDKIENICNRIKNIFDIQYKEIDWKEYNSEYSKLCGKIESDDCDILITIIKKNMEEYNIIIDISSNKLYKSIVDIYRKLDSNLSNYSDDVDICVCIVGEYTKRLQMHKYNEILEKLLYNMNANIIDEVKDDNFISITSYSKILRTNSLEYLDDKINLNIAVRYSETEDRTLIYIATPIIKLDY